jgi:hypothetical protein
MSAPLLQPVRASEAVALAELLFKGPATPVRLLANLPSLGLQHTKVFPHTLAADPVHANSWYLLVANAANEYWLLHLTSAAAPASTLFPKPLLLARARISSDFEIVANAIPALENLGIIIPILAPHLLARATSLHDIWSIPAASDWPSFVSSIPQRNDALPAVRSNTTSWTPYLPVLLSPTPFAYIRTNTPPDLSASDTLPFSRFSIAVPELSTPRLSANHIQRLRALAPRAIDIELDFSQSNANEAQVHAYLNDLRLLGVTIEGVELPAHIPPESLSSPHLSITIAAAEPREHCLAGKVHWKLSASAM